jgi:hypothetical protein
VQSATDAIETPDELFTRGELGGCLKAQRQHFSLNRMRDEMPDAGPSQLAVNCGATALVTSSVAIATGANAQLAWHSEYDVGE